MGQREIGSYVVDELIGAGASGKVWRARHRDTGELVALKVLRGGLGSDPRDRERLMAEGHLMAGRDLPGTVRLRDVIVEDDEVALVMDLIDGTDLRPLVGKGPLMPAMAARLGAQVAAALAGAHAQGLTHRDVKPENVLLTGKDSAHPTALLTDFGLARSTHSTSVTQSHTQMSGTPFYVAPEVLTGSKATPAGDVYALGVMIYEMVMGWRPFRREQPAALMQQHLHEIPIRPAEFPPALWSIVSRCLEKDPSHRPTAQELAAELEAVATELSDVPAVGRSEPPAPPELTTAWSPSGEAAAGKTGPRRRTVIAAAVAVIALVLAGSGIYLLLSPPGRFVGAPPTQRATPQPTPAPTQPTTPRPTPAPTSKTPTASASPPTSRATPPAVTDCPSKAVTSTFANGGASYTVNFNDCGDGRMYVHRFNVSVGAQPLIVTPVVARSDLKGNNLVISWRTRSGIGQQCPCRLEANSTMAWNPERSLGAEFRKWVYVAWTPGKRDAINSGLVELR